MYIDWQMKLASLPSTMRNVIKHSNFCFELKYLNLFHVLISRPCSFIYKLWRMFHFFTKFWGWFFMSKASSLKFLKCNNYVFFYKLRFWRNCMQKWYWIIIIFQNFQILAWILNIWFFQFANWDHAYSFTKIEKLITF